MKLEELEEKLVGLQYSEDSLRRYRKVFREFEEYAGDCDYSQSKGTDFLLWKFKQLGGFVTSGEHSKNEMYYFRAIRSLAEYFNFGTLFRRHDYHGEIVWPIPFKEVTEGFLKYEVEYGCSHYQYRRCRDIIKDLISREPQPAPMLISDEFIQDFYQFTPDSFKLAGYTPLDFDVKIPIAM